MQVLESKQYSNFVNSINSEQIRRQYEHSLTQFLKHYQIDLDSFLGLSQKEMSDFIKSLKIQFRDNPDYESVIEQANREKIDYEYRMQVIPISFSQYGKELLGRFQYFVSKGLFSVPSIFADLIMDMRTASYLDNGNLDKKAVGNRTFDLLDSTRLALKLFEKSDKH